MDKSGYDVPTDLMDNITTNYLSKIVHPNTPRESMATPQG